MTLFATVRAFVAEFKQMDLTNCVPAGLDQTSSSLLMSMTEAHLL